MKKQRVIRTFPHNYTNPTTVLREALSDGYVVVMCNQTYLEKGATCLEYIVEKEEPDI